MNHNATMNTAAAMPQYFSWSRIGRAMMLSGRECSHIAHVAFRFKSWLLDWGGDRATIRAARRPFCTGRLRDRRGAPRVAKLSRGLCDVIVSPPDMH